MFSYLCPNTACALTQPLKAIRRMADQALANLSSRFEDLYARQEIRFWRPLVQRWTNGGLNFEVRRWCRVYVREVRSVMETRLIETALEPFNQRALVPQTISGLLSMLFRMR